MAYVYLLRCADDSLYCGWTVHLARRLAAHQAGRGSRYTRSRLPVALAAAWEARDRSAALSLEARVKRLPRAGKEALVAVSRPSPAPAGTPGRRGDGAAGPPPSPASSR